MPVGENLPVVQHKEGIICIQVPRREIPAWRNFISWLMVLDSDPYLYNREYCVSKGKTSLLSTHGLGSVETFVPHSTI